MIPGHTAPRSWKELNSWDVLLAAALLLLAALFCFRSMSAVPHEWRWSALWPYVAFRGDDGLWRCGMLAQGFFSTIRLGAWSLLVALLSGGIVGALSARQKGMASWPATFYVTVLRNTPPLVLLFLVYFFAGSFFTEPFLRVEAKTATLPFWMQEAFRVCFAPPGQMDRMAAAVLTLGLYSGAYVAEIVRGALEAVHESQWDAAASLGMNERQQLCWIIAPQACRIMIPPLTGQCISVFKETALASVVSLPELTFQSLEAMAVSRMTYELWMLVAAMYLGISLFWSALGRYLERRIAAKYSL